jgi:hypothetical protein
MGSTNKFDPGDKVILHHEESIQHWNKNMLAMDGKPAHVTKFVTEKATGRNYIYVADSGYGFDARCAELVKAFVAESDEDKYCIDDIILSLTNNSLFYKHAIFYINEIRRSKNEAYRAFREYICKECAKIEIIYGMHSSARRLALSVISVRLIEHYAKKLNIDVSLFMDMYVPDYVGRDAGYFPVVKAAEPILRGYSADIIIIDELDGIEADPYQQVANLINSKEETTMSNVNVAIENITFIFGQPASSVSDDSIYGYITTMENQVEAMGKTKNQPEKLKAKIAKVKDDIAKLVAFVDERE